MLRGDLWPAMGRLYAWMMIKHQYNVLCEISLRLEDHFYRQAINVIYGL